MFWIPGGSNQFLFLGGSPSFFVQFRSFSAMIYVLKMVVTTVVPYVLHRFLTSIQAGVATHRDDPRQHFEGAMTGFFLSEPAEGAPFTMVFGSFLGHFPHVSSNLGHFKGALGDIFKCYEPPKRWKGDQFSARYSPTVFFFLFPVEVFYEHDDSHKLGALQHPRWYWSWIGLHMGHP